MVIYALVAILIAFLLDLLIGDPQDWPHLVRAQGTLIRFLERFLYKLKNKREGGAILVFIVVLVNAAFFIGLAIVTWILSPWLYLAWESILGWQVLAARSLSRESMLVYFALRDKGLIEGRKRVSYIVGRDPTSLDEEGVTRATVETIAENTADGIIAPLFYMLIGGAPLAAIYKAINTMDSMLGYKNDKYLDFGRAAALVDDYANYLPSRLAALLMIVAAGLGGFSTTEAWRVWHRDRRKHTSPNSGQTEAVMAGALGIVLGGASSYGGREVVKPTLGDFRRPIELEDIRRSQKIMWLTTLLMLMLIIALRVFLLLVIGSDVPSL